MEEQRCEQGIGHIGPFTLCMWLGVNRRERKGYLCQKCIKSLSAYLLAEKK